MGERADGLIIIPVRHGPFWNFSYVVGDRRSGEALVIDPAWDVSRMLGPAAEAGLRVVAAAVTHGHHDHAHGLDEIMRATSARVYVHHADALLLQESYAGPVTRIEHGYEVVLGEVTITMLHTPGHTAGSQCVLAGRALFTGDTLMVGSGGRAGAEAGAAALMRRSFEEVILRLPDTTEIYPGHDYGPRPTSTLAEERRRNPALQPHRREDIVR